MVQIKKGYFINMSKILILCLTLVLSACGSSGGDGGDTPPTAGPGTGINVAIQPFVDQFQTAFAATISFKVDFDTIGATGSSSGSGTTVGVCRTWSNGDREVLINKDWWNGTTDPYRKILIFHELGHCYFNRSHDSTKETNVASPYYNMPRSIMYPVINPIVTWYNTSGAFGSYASYPDYYHQELSGAITFSSGTVEAGSYDPNAGTYEEYIPSHEEDPTVVPHDHSDGCVHFVE